MNSSSGEDQLERVELYERMISMSRQALDAELYEASYHCMAAAMYAARAIGDDARLIDLSLQATEAQIILDDHEPAHTMASRRGHVGFFEIVHRLAFQHQQLVFYKRSRSARNA